MTEAENTKKLFDLLSKTGYPVAYHDYKESGLPSAPYLCFYANQSDNVAADNMVHYKIRKYNVELYCGGDRMEAQQKVEAVLDDNSIFYNKAESYVEELGLYMIIYDITLI